MPVDYGRFGVEFEIDWKIDIREVLPDNPLDIIKGADHRLADKLEGVSEVEAEYDSLPEGPVVIKIAGFVEIDVPLPDDMVGMSEVDIHSELMMNAEYELARELNVEKRDINVLSITEEE